MSEERIVEGVRLSNPGKVLDPEQGITKGELADYYAAVAEPMLPHVANRPVTLVRCLAADAPERYLTRISKAERAGRIFIDYLRNDPTSTAVGPCSTRSRPGAPVAMPVEWEALNQELDPCAFTLETVSALAGSRADPWKAMGTVRQRLPNL